MRKDPLMGIQNSVVCLHCYPNWENGVMENWGRFLAGTKRCHAQFGSLSSRGENSVIQDSCRFFAGDKINGAIGNLARFLREFKKKSRGK